MSRSPPPAEHAHAAASDAALRGGSTAGRLARGLIRGYGLLVSPVLGRNCRYLPTCSAYADEAIARHGLWLGGWMTLARLCRCQPFGASGFDPVPAELPENARPWTPWRAARWTGRHIDPKTRLDT